MRVLPTRQLHHPWDMPLQAQPWQDLPAVNRREAIGREAEPRLTNRQAPAEREDSMANDNRERANLADSHERSNGMTPYRVDHTLTPVGSSCCCEVDQSNLLHASTDLLHFHPPFTSARVPRSCPSGIPCEPPPPPFSMATIAPDRKKSTRGGEPAAKRSNHIES